MKKLLMVFVIPFLVFSSIIGVGYSTWYFADQLSVTEKTNVSIQISKYAKVGDIQILSGGEDTNSLDFSQTHIEFLTPVIVKYLTPTDPSAEVVGVKINFTYELQLSQDIELYADLLNTDLTLIDAQQHIYQGNWGTSYDMNNPKDFTFTFHPRFTYQHEMQPTAEEEFQRMYQTLIDEIIQIRFITEIERGNI